MKTVGANVGRGAVMGLADVVPGVSGGTMALLLGIYPRFIAALASLDLELAKSALGIFSTSGRQHFAQKWREADMWFLVQVGVGLVAAILIAAHFIEAALHQWPLQMMALFFGLIIASIRIPWQQIAAPSMKLIPVVILGAAFAAIVSLQTSQGAEPALWFIVIAGALAITAMLLPGISGSALLVLLGVYPVVLAAVSEVNIVVLGLFAVGAIAGLLVASKGIRWLLFVKHDHTMAALTGLMAGSLVRVWPWRTVPEFGQGLPALPASMVIIGIIFIIVGAVTSWGLERLGAQIDNSSSD